MVHAGVHNQFNLLGLGQNDLGNEGVRTLTTVLPPNLHLLDVSQNGIGVCTCRIAVFS